MVMQDTYKQVFMFEDPPLHDPCAVAYVIAPHLFKVRPVVNLVCCPGVALARLVRGT